jgi:acetylornithine deacetylase/succinyl-diaminopimelate desuccinylase-like protein
MDVPLVDAYLEAHLDASLEELATLVAQPSISAQGVGLEECARLVRGMLVARGFQAEIVPTEGAPVVIAERAGASPRTLLFYNHYDVQPPEPLELWQSPPFQATRREGRVYGRGISDDKGHLVARLFALDALLAVHGGLPCRVKFVVEGEEEVASPHLPPFVRAHRERLAADACVWEFGQVDHREVPVQYLGLRGICYVELSVETAAVDVHSGVGGSILENPAWRLTWALASLKGPDGRVRIPGFYDAAKPPTARDVELLEALPEVADEYRQRFGVKGFLRGMTGGVELRVAEVFEPTCTICGLTSGYQGPGPKTVLPARASAKVDFRLVPDMRPETVLRQLRAHLDAEGFGDVRVDPLGGGAPARTDPDHPFIRLVCEQAEPVYGVPMRLVPMLGGSGPNHAFVHDLGLPVAAAGLGHPDSLVHAPNENIRVDLYLKHAKHMARVLAALGEAG